MEETAKGICISTTRGCNLVTLPQASEMFGKRCKELKFGKRTTEEAMIWPYAMYPLSTWWSDICVAGFVLKSKTESVDKPADSQSPHWGTKRGTLDNAHGLHPRKTHARDSFAASRDEVIIVRSAHEGKDFAKPPWFWAPLHLINLLPESKWRPC